MSTTKSNHTLWSDWHDVAQIIKPHGSNGGLVVVSRFNDLNLSEGDTICIVPPPVKETRYRTVESVNCTGERPIIHLDGCSDRNEAEQLRGKHILVSGEIQTRGESVPVDCLGREVYDLDRGLLGTIEEVIETPANFVWVVQGPFRELLIPVIDEVVDLDNQQGEDKLEVTLLPGIIEDDE